MLPFVVSGAANACDVSVPRWFPVLPDDDGAPVNAAFLVDEDEEVELLDASGAAVELVREPLGPAWAWRPVAELAPDATYTATGPFPQWTFTTGDEALAQPAVPRVEVVDQRDPLWPGCGTPPRSVDLDGEVEGVLLAMDASDGAGDSLREDVLLHPALRLPESVAVDPSARALRFGTIDAAGQWSGWSEPVELRGGCGSSSAGSGAGALVGLPLAWVRRRRR